MAELKRRAMNVLIALDQLAWTVLTIGNGSPDETISAALWRMEIHGKWAGVMFRPIVDAVFWPIEDNHCRASFLAELNRRQLPKDYAKNQF